MNYWKVIFSTIVIFGAGVFTGGLLVNYVHQTYVHAAAAHHPPPATNAVAIVATNTSPHLPEVLSRPFLPKLDDLLHLSPDQHKAIEKIIMDAQGQMRKVTQDTKNAIRTTLTPDQRSAYDDIMKRSVKHTTTTNGNANAGWTLSVTNGNTNSAWNLSVTDSVAPPATNSH